MKKYYVLSFFIVLIIVAMIFFKKDLVPEPIVNPSPKAETDVMVVKVTDDSISSQFKEIKEKVLYPTQARDEDMFEKVVLNADPKAHLAQLVGSANTDIVLRLNRIDIANLKAGSTLVIPKSLDDFKNWQYMPNKISSAVAVPKLIIVSQPIQAFGVYENGILVRSGPISSGRQSKQTPSGLFFVNWKGEETVSTFDDEWVLRWNMNIDNFAGVSLHQYSLPGYPASHSCVRLTEADAYWLYNWTDEWKLKNDVVNKKGTPVIIYGEYDFNNPAPWLSLDQNSKSTDTPRSILESLVKGYLVEIKKGGEELK